MKPGKFLILLIALIFLASIGFKSLHPLYHEHKYGSTGHEPTVQVDSPQSCYIDDFQFYQRIQLDAEETPLNKAPLFSRISIFFILPIFNGTFIHYLLRAPPSI